MRQVSTDEKLGRMLLWLMAVTYPLTIGTALYLSVGQGWPWYEGVLVGFSTLWITGIVWIAWWVITSTD